MERDDELSFAIAMRPGVDGVDPANVYKKENAQENDMQLFGILIPGAFLWLGLMATTTHRFERCLPSGIKVADVVSAQLAKPGRTANKITVDQKLAEMKARCKRGRLVDASGKEIRFYRLTGCWGNPPADYQEILARQAEEIEKLKKQYTVIEMTCNPDPSQVY